MSTTSVHPCDALFDASEAAVSLPVCDHYAGVEARMRKSLDLQAELGPVLDVTLDNEDGAPVGGEREHAQLIAELVTSPANRFGRVGARMLPVDHPAFADVAKTLVRDAGARLAYLMLPKPRSLADVERAAQEVDRLSVDAHLARRIPLHALIETHGALQHVQAIAAHPRIESLSFGLMDFVSAHRGAIPQSGMSVTGQFEHPLVVRAKLEIAAACHAAGKVPSHCVVTEFKDERALAQAADKAARQFGYTRMWSIHPAQIRTIVDAFSPTVAEVDQAIEILMAARDANWAPIRHRDTLHDRASFRYFWHVLARAHRTSFADGPQLPTEVRQAFFNEATA
ncbi:HpcH/HpaI aldolase/citrate lyase family protein [Ideonella sp. BN130291]|uniref:HpcH/HpaI aldolase/citrate lyase family protein n=1 Tax=Ideonella sp. BN130291 TaxID=3112940 RepID=UPI002E252A77|nr:aldolase/citrate lyase family protein [Ideonella sp. BN130291]